MKKIFALISFIVISFALFAQTPQVFKYQTVVRDAGGAVYANKIVSFRISILLDNPAGTSVYVETHNTTTNDFGIVNLNIGAGSVVSGSFGAVDWGTHEHFIKTEIDMLGGTDFQFMGTSQLLSVPYALFAGKSANAADDYDKDSTNEIQTISEVGNTVTLSHGGGSFTDTDTDNQTLSLNGTQLQISNGNSVDIGGTVDLDWDPANEIQNLTLNGNTLSISQGNSINLPPDTDYDTTNEIQTLSKVGSTITLSNGGGSVTDSDNQNLSSTSNGTQRTIDISGGAGTTINVADNDNDSINELQTLTYSDGTLSITSGNSVYLPNLNEIAIFEYQLPSGATENTVFSGNVYWTRKLNTTTFDNSPNISRNGDTIILETGIYLINSSAPCYLCRHHRIRLRNITDNIISILGTSENSYYDDEQNRSFIDGVITLSSTKKFLIEHYSSYAAGSPGEPVSTGENEVYTRVLIKKLD